MDLIATLPEDDTPISQKDQYFVDLLVNNMQLGNVTPPPPEAPTLGLCTKLNLDSLFDKFKYTIFVGLVAALIFSPILDLLLKSFMGPIPILLVKTVLFMIVHYFVFVREYSK